MSFYVHYQERAVNTDSVFEGTDKLVSDYMMSFEEFLEMYDDVISEHLLNSIGEWSDNGVVYLDSKGIVCDYSCATAQEFPLEFRVRHIVCEGNLREYMHDHRPEPTARLEPLFDMGGV